MSTVKTNEAAERLRLNWRNTGPMGYYENGKRFGHDLDEALAAERPLERHATVERIRKGLLPRGGRAYYSEPWQRMLADRLDDEAAR